MNDRLMTQIGPERTHNGFLTCRYLGENSTFWEAFEFSQTVDIENIQNHSLKMEVEMSKKASKTSVWSKA